MKKRLVLLTMLVLLLIAAKPLKATFLDVGGPADTVEFAGKGGYSQCVYWAADEYTDYAEYLGWYGSAEFAVDPLQFCLDNFYQAEL